MAASLWGCPGFLWVELRLDSSPTLRDVSAGPTAVLFGSDLWSLPVSTQSLSTPTEEHLRLGSAGWQHRPSVRFSLWPDYTNELHILLWDSETPLMSWPISCQWGRFTGCRNLSSFMAPFHRCRSHPDSFLLFLFVLFSYLVMWRFS